jgi:hypothetical protein
MACWYPDRSAKFTVGVGPLGTAGLTPTGEMGEIRVGNGPTVGVPSATVTTVSVGDGRADGGLSAANRGTQAKVAVRNRNARLAFLVIWLIINIYFKASLQSISYQILVDKNYICSL